MSAAVVLVTALSLLSGGICNVTTAEPPGETTNNDGVPLKQAESADILVRLHGRLSSYRLSLFFKLAQETLEAHICREPIYINWV